MRSTRRHVCLRVRLTGIALVKRRLWLLLLLTGLSSPLARQTAGAQDINEKRERSHADISFPLVDPAEAEKFLARRLRRAEDLAALEKLAREIAGDPKKFGLGKEEMEQLRQLTQGWGKGTPPDFKDEKWRKLLEGVLGKQNGQPGSGVN